MQKINKHLIVVVGPTGVGKTSVAIQLASFFNSEIISADSRQFFKELSIGTARPSLEELRERPHHFIANLSIEENYTAGKFEADAISKIETLHRKNSVVLMVGGSGLYIDAVCNGLDKISGDLEIKKELGMLYRQYGIEYLQERLNQVDPDYYQQVDKNNPHRLIRAIEVFEVSGAPYSKLRKQNRVKRNFNIIKIGLHMERADLYQRINGRVNDMIAKGLEEEAKAVYPYKNKPALKTVGYVEFFNFFDGLITRETAIELIKRNSRRYAKRQLTWFKKDTNTTWFHPDETENIIQHLQSKLANSRY